MLLNNFSKKTLILAVTMKSTPFLGRPSTYWIFGLTVLDVVVFVGLGELLDRPLDQFSSDFANLPYCLGVV